MIRILFGLCSGLLVSSAACADDASWLTRPADPAAATSAPRYTSVTAGMKRFRVVEPKNWLTLNQAAASRSGSGMGDMKSGGMPGLKMNRAESGSMPGMNMRGKGAM